MVNQDAEMSDLPKAFLRGLSTAHISGRAQIVYDYPPVSCCSSGVPDSSSGDLIFFLDGAHSPESMEACAQWFSNAVKEGGKLSSESTFAKVGNMEIQRNGYVRQEKEKIDRPNKISKQVKSGIQDVMACSV